MAASTSQKAQIDDIMSYRRVLLLASLLPASHGMRLSSRATSSRPLGRSAKEFADSLRGGDVHLPTFIAAAKAYCDLVQRFGKFAAPSAAEVRRCVRKVEDAVLLLSSGAFADGPSRGSCKKARASMKALLQAEKAVTGLHKSRGEIGDPSGAMGLLWTRRAMCYWVDVFEQASAAQATASCRTRPVAAAERMAPSG